MKRRVFAAVVAVAGGLIGSSCSSVSPPAISVNGSEISQSDFDSLVEAITASNLAQEPEPTQNPNLAQGVSARDAASAMIVTKVIEQIAAASGRPISDTDRAAVAAELEADAGFKSRGASLQQAIVGYTTAQRVIAELPPPAPADVEAMYAKGAATSRILCLSHILVPTEADAAAAQDALNAGTAFADVASLMSIDTGSAANGGALTGRSGDCLTVAQAAQTFVPEFTAGALTAIPGVPTAPVKSEFGYHIILARPWSEISEAALAVGSAARIDQTLQTADVSVDRSIGVWLPTAGSVVALDDPRLAG